MKMDLSKSKTEISFLLEELMKIWYGCDREFGSGLIELAKEPNKYKTTIKKKIIKLLRESLLKKSERVIPHYDIIGIEYNSRYKEFIPGGFGTTSWVFYEEEKENEFEVKELLKRVYSTRLSYLDELKKSWLQVHYSALNEEISTSEHVISIPHITMDNPENENELKPKLNSSFFISQDQSSFYKKKGIGETEIKNILSTSSKITLTIQKKQKRIPRYILYIPTYIAGEKKKLDRIGGIVFMGTQRTKIELCDFLELAVKIILTYLRITESNLVETLIQKSQDEESMKAFFLRRLSHDLRHPLYAFNDFFESLKKQVEVYSNSIFDIIRILDTTLAAIEFGFYKKIPLLTTRDIIFEFLEDIQWSFQSTLEKNNRDIEIKVTPQDLEFVFDRTFIKEVLNNLIVNTIKYGHGLIKLSAKTKNNNFIIIVEDEGPGLTEYIRKNWGQPYHGRDIDDKTSGEGRGLGLWISKQLMELHGGTLELDEKAKKYTKWKLTIPQKKGA